MKNSSIIFGAIAALGVALFMSKKTGTGDDSGSSAGLLGGLNISMPDITMPSVQFPNIAFPNIAFPAINVGTGGGGLSVPDVVDIIKNTGGGLVGSTNLNVPGLGGVGIGDFLKFQGDVKGQFDAITALINQGKTGIEGALDLNGRKSGSGDGSAETGTKDTGLSWESWSNFVTRWQNTDIPATAYSVSGLSETLQQAISVTPGLSIISGALPGQTPAGMGFVAPWTRVVYSEDAGKIIPSLDAVKQAMTYQKQQEGRTVQSGRKSGSGVNAKEPLTEAKETIVAYGGYTMPAGMIG